MSAVKNLLGYLGLAELAALCDLHELGSSRTNLDRVNKLSRLYKNNFSKLTTDLIRIGGEELLFELKELMIKEAADDDDEIVEASNDYFENITQEWSYPRNLARVFQALEIDPPRKFSALRYQELWNGLDQRGLEMQCDGLTLSRDVRPPSISVRVRLRLRGKRSVTPAASAKEAPKKASKTEPNKKGKRTGTQITIFISYTHNDMLYRENCEVHLAQIRRSEGATVWCDKYIEPGTEIDVQISEYLRKADIILLLVSARYIDSHFCYQVELAKALERHHRNEARIIPVIIGHCMWKATSFGKLKALPKDGRPISSWTHPDEAWLEVAEAVHKAVTDLRTGRTLAIGSDRVY